MQREGLWEGETSDLDEDAEQLSLTSDPASTAAPAGAVAGVPQQLSLFPSPTQMPPSTPPPTGEYYPIPAERSGWLARVLGRTAAAAALLFAGESDHARRFVNERQSHRSFGEDEFHLGTLETRNTGVGKAVGVRHTVRWQGDQQMEVFHGLDAESFAALRDNGVGQYVSGIRGGEPIIVGSGTEILVKTGDGTMTGFRLRPRGRRQRR
ncbi:hypothetical protein AB0C12_12560 [Actinoplanes sp. NPDC048967]|uniref:hypothetical protein n=1 Tax=Actinoplanes sp. NPDC048967 TaxID=3155269 RepID=UPI0033CFDAAB